MIPEGRFENVKRSLYAYIQSNFTESAIDFQGSDVFRSKDANDWVWFGVSSRTHQFVRSVSDSRSGDIVRFLLHAVVYVKPTEDIMRMEHVADALRDLIPPRAAISVYDHVGTGTAIGHIVNQGIVADRNAIITIPGSAEGDLPIHIIDFELQYLAEYEQ